MRFDFTALCSWSEYSSFVNNDYWLIQGINSGVRGDFVFGFIEVDDYLWIHWGPIDFWLVMEYSGIAKNSSFAKWEDYFADISGMEGFRKMVRGDVLWEIPFSTKMVCSHFWINPLRLEISMKWFQNLSFLDISTVFYLLIFILKLLNAMNT